MFVSGLVSVTFRSKTPEEIITVCVKNDLKAIEWGENAHVFAGDAQGAARVGEMTRAAGLKVAGYGSYFRLDTDDQPEDFLPSLKSAAALGAPVIRVWAGKQGSDTADVAYRASVAEKAHAIAQLAEPYGIKVAFEWHRNTLTDTNESALALIDAADHPNLYSLWQPTPEIPFEQRAAAIEKLGDKLAHLHVYSWSDGRKRLPFEAALDRWETYLSAIDPHREMYALMEFVLGDTEEQLEADAKVLNDFLDQINAH